MYAIVKYILNLYRRGVTRVIAIARAFRRFPDASRAAVSLGADIADETVRIGSAMRAAPTAMIAEIQSNLFTGNLWEISATSSTMDAAGDIYNTWMINGQSNVTYASIYDSVHANIQNLLELGQLSPRLKEYLQKRFALGIDYAIGTPTIAALEKMSAVGMSWI